MGRHSASGGREGRSDGMAGGSGSGFGSGSGIPGGPPPSPAAPGTGRRRRAPGRSLQPPAPARQPARRPEWAYSHPEHREHEAWGGAESWSTGPGGSAALLGPDVDDLLEDDRSGVAFGAPPAAPRVPRRRTPGGRIQAPRRDFVEAFDELPPGGPGSGSGSGSEGPPPKGGGKGRNFGGAGAAAVVTVLAVVVAGQLAGGGKQSSSASGRTSATASRAADGSASRSDTRATAASPAASAVALTYDQAMARPYALKADLALSGRFRTVGGHQKAPGKGKVYRVRVDVEQGLPLDGEVFAQAVYKTLNDSRSWGHGGTKTFERVSTGAADIVITLASPGTTDVWCAKSGLDTSVENVSCDSASTPRTLINAYRWAQGSETYGPSRMLMYRQMLINHEVGHRLGHSHELCPRNGALAPVMMQQTKFLTLNGVTCKPNPWPYPKG